MFVEEVAQFLTRMGIAVYEPEGVGGNLFIEGYPDSPTNLVALLSTGGIVDEPIHPIDTPTIQVLVRNGNDPRQAAAVSERIYDTLHGLPSGYLVEGGKWVVSCVAVDLPHPIGVDELGRHQYTLNFQFEIENNTSNRSWLGRAN